MAAGECLKLPAGLRYAVHFMVDARKKRDPWTFFLHESASDETASVETTSAGITSVEMSRGASETTVDLKTRFTTRCTTAFSSSRTQPKMCSTYAGGAFHSAEIGLSGPPFSSGWNIRSSHRREPTGYSGKLRITSSKVRVVRMLTGSVYCGISSTWLRCSCRISLTNSQKLSALVRFSAPLAAHPCRSPPETSGRSH